MESHGSLRDNMHFQQLLDLSADNMIVSLGRRAPQKLVDEIWLALRLGNEVEARRRSILLRVVETKLAIRPSA